MTSVLPLPNPTAASEGTSPDPSSSSSTASEEAPSSTEASEGDSQPPPDFPDLHTAGHRRSARLRANRSRVAAALISLLFLPVVIGQFIGAPVSFIARHFAHQEYINMNPYNTPHSLNPFSFVATTSDNEVYHFGDVLKQPDLPDFLKAMIVEVNDHTKRGHWIIRPRSAIGDQKPIRTVWSFKRKRAPDGTLLKHKARLCVNGATQNYGVNYWNTYTPVVSWLAVRLMFILSVIEGWYSESIDFTLAFPQAEVEIPMFVEFPVGVNVVGYDRTTHVFGLKKKLYGMKQASSQGGNFKSLGCELVALCPVSLINASF